MGAGGGAVSDHLESRDRGWDPNAETESCGGARDPHTHSRTREVGLTTDKVDFGVSFSLGERFAGESVAHPANQRPIRSPRPVDVPGRVGSLRLQGRCRDRVKGRGVP